MGRAEHLRLRHDREGARHALSAEGELDLVSAPALEAAVAEACAEGAQELVVDLHRLDFMDSAGLRALVHSRRLCEQHGCDFSLARVQPPTRRLFEVTGLVGRLGTRGHSPADGRSADGAANPLAARRPDLDVPLELNFDAPRSARNYVRDILRALPSRTVRETAMLLTSDLVTPLVARAPATFLQTGELRVWLHADAVRVEVLVSRAVVSPDETAGGIYDAALFARLGAQVTVGAGAAGVRVAFELHPGPHGEHAPSRVIGAQPGASLQEP
jgi:anti-sigma B factor antagonist